MNITDKQPWQMTQQIYGEGILTAGPEFVKGARSHRFHVERALSEGKLVPNEVLADYPDLQKPDTASVDKESLTAQKQIPEDGKPIQRTPAKGKLLPMEQQYDRIRREIPGDTLLTFKLGDFYEFYFEDAEKAAEILGITLTKRNGKSMAGVVYHAADESWKKLIDAGYKVAVAELMEDGGRKVTQFISPSKEQSKIPKETTK